MDKHQAIRELCPNATFSIVNNDYSTIWWDSDNNSESQPTEAEVNAKETAIQTRDAHISARMRVYPDVVEQLDLLYKDMLADKGNKTGEWFKAVKAVKDANPKA